jgi:hypothetical protein
MICVTDRQQQEEAKVEALLATSDEGTPVKFRPCGVWKEILFLKL